MSEDGMNDVQNDGQSGAPRAGVIREVGLLDLRYAKTEEDLAGITLIEEVGAILIPEHLGAALARIPMSEVGGIVPIPHDRKVSCMTGQVRLSGESLAAGADDTVLVIAGQAFITGEMTTVGFAEVRVYGQLFYPRSGEAAMGAKLTQLTGQCFSLPTDPRFTMGTDSINQEFLEYLPKPVAWVVMGTLTFEEDVRKETLREKILEIVVMGTIRAPRPLLPLLNVLATDKMGSIDAL